MKKKRLLSISLTLLLCSVMALTGCQKKSDAAEKPELDCPFTELDWDNTLEEILEEEGGAYGTYDSVYNGTTYTFEKEYEGKTGTIKYMFDDKDKLMCVAWTYVGSSTDEINDLYKDIHDSVTEEHGDSHQTGKDTNNVNNSGDVWYLNSGDIIISTVDTDQQKVLQYAFLHPDVSNSEESE